MLSNYLKSKLQYLKDIFALTKICLNAEYKASFLGFAWTIIHPTISVLLYAFVVSQIFKHNQEGYVVFLVGGVLPWIFISSSLKISCNAIISNRDKIMRSTLPIYTFPFLVVAKQLYNFLVSFSFIYMILLLYGVLTFQFSHLLLVVAMLFIMVFTSAMAVVMSIITPYFRDFKSLVDIVFQLLFWFSAIIYPLEIVPEQYHFVYYLNPIFLMIDPFRDILYSGSFEFEILFRQIIFIILSLILVVFFHKKLLKNIIWYL